MENLLKNLNVWCWRYPNANKSYSGIHFTAKSKSCQIVLDYMDIIKNEGNRSKRTIPLKSLNGEMDCSGLQAKSFNTLCIEYRLSCDELHQMLVYYQNNKAFFIFTEKRWHDLVKRLSDIRDGFGDFTIGPINDKKKGLFIGELDKKSENLSFWPCFGHMFAKPDWTM
jgi:hypothetical protein